MDPDAPIPDIARVLAGEILAPPPVWLMRQAGRYLPEYREIRKKFPDFLSMVYAPQTAAEITMQPVRRFGMDGAILFSDILVVPDALGTGVRFEEGRGPVLEALAPQDALPEFNPERFDQKIAPVCETLGLCREKLAGEGFQRTALIGFAGGPFTLAAYMIEGAGSRDFLRARHYAFAYPEKMAALISLLGDASVHYLCRQIEAGARIVQIFESWAGILSPALFEELVTIPHQRMIAALKARYPDVPVIAFPRGAGLMLEDYARKVPVQGLGIDERVPPGFAAGRIQPRCAVQGNLDPALLLAGGKALERGVRHILDVLGGGRLIFNLGHGVDKHTPPEHVAALVSQIRNGESR